MKRSICLLLTCCALLLCGCDVNEMTTLKELSRPYTGEYQCKTLRLGDEDLLPMFESLRLGLDGNGTFELCWRDTFGGEGSFAGDYKLSEEEETITLSAVRGGRERTFVFPYEHGAVQIGLLFGGKPFYAEFSMTD